MKIFDSELGEHPFPRRKKKLKQLQLIEVLLLEYTMQKPFNCLNLLTNE